MVRENSLNYRFSDESLRQGFKAATPQLWTKRSSSGLYISLHSSTLRHSFLKTGNYRNLHVSLEGTLHVTFIHTYVLSEIFVSNL